MNESLHYVALRCIGNVMFYMRHARYHVRHTVATMQLPIVYIFKRILNV